MFNQSQTSSQFMFSSPYIKPDFPPDLTHKELLVNALEKLKVTGKAGKTPNAFMAYRMALRKQISKTGFRPTMGELSTIAGNLWESEPQNVKEAYQKLSREVKIMFDEMWQKSQQVKLVNPISSNHAIEFNPQHNYIPSNQNSENFTTEFQLFDYELLSFEQSLADLETSEQTNIQYQLKLPLNYSEKEEYINSSFPNQSQIEQIDLNLSSSDFSDESQMEFSPEIYNNNNNEPFMSFAFKDNAFENISEISLEYRVSILEILIKNLLIQHKFNINLHDALQGNVAQKVAVLENLTYEFMLKAQN
ncbi:hypothetical protein G9A89_001009 [Geosiphon pyriformis]|nr:hypothetical protein G9A89_001009 [Geosiphon pyriformis]